MLLHTLMPVMTSFSRGGTALLPRCRERLPVPIAARALTPRSACPVPAAPLDEDIDRADAKVLAHSFDASNQHVYGLLSHDARVQVLPSGYDGEEYRDFLTLQLPPPSPPAAPPR